MNPLPIETVFSNRRIYSISSGTRLKEIREYTQGYKTYIKEETVHLNNVDNAYTISETEFRRRISDVFSFDFIDISRFSSVLLIGKHIEVQGIELNSGESHLSTSYKSPMIYDIFARFEAYISSKAWAMKSLFRTHNEVSQEKIDRYETKVLKKLRQTETFLVIFNRNTSEELSQIYKDLQLTKPNKLRILFIHIVGFDIHPKINFRIYNTGFV